MKNVFAFLGIMFRNKAKKIKTSYLARDLSARPRITSVISTKNVWHFVNYTFRPQ